MIYAPFVMYLVKSSLLLRRVLAAVVLGGFLLSAMSSSAGLKIYYLRHGESGANVAKDWKDVEKAKRPSYVGNADSFSPLGEQQVAGVADKLKAYHFDFIAVSPLWRTRHTILPYLAAGHRQGEIWPELAEFGQTGGSLDLVGTVGLPAPATDLLSDKTVILPPEEKAFFLLGENTTRELKIRKENPSDQAADVTRLQQIVIDRIKQRFAGTDTSILLVGHGNAGRALLHVLTGNDEAAKHHIENAVLWMAEEQADGSFKVVMFNDKAFTK
jgi:broad specificity phosphatase PhoE